MAQARNPRARASKRGTQPPKTATAASAGEDSATKAAACRKSDQQSATQAPERIVVKEPPPRPDYPRYRVEPEQRLKLADADPGATEHYESKRDVKQDLADQRSRISGLQARLYAEHERSLLIVLQAMDTGGKDGTIRGVFADHIINEWEHALTLSGDTVLRFSLHISRDEQKKRLESHWDDYMAAFEDALNNTSTAYAPWYVVPSNVKWYRNLVMARTIADTLEAMDSHYPPAASGLDDVVVPA